MAKSQEELEHSGFRETRKSVQDSVKKQEPVIVVVNNADINRTVAQQNAVLNRMMQNLISVVERLNNKPKSFTLQIERDNIRGWMTEIKVIVDE